MPPKVVKKAESSTTPTHGKAEKLATPKSAKVASTPSKTLVKTTKTPEAKAAAGEKNDSEKKSPAKRVRTEADSRSLVNTGAFNNQIMVTYDDSPDAKHGKTGFTHSIKMSCPDSFSLVTTVTMVEGPFKGCQLIVLQPPKSLEFLKLQPLVRKRVYDFYFACKGILDDPIPLETKRKGTGDNWAKAYSEGSKYRVALLAANKQVHSEALLVLYAKAIRVPDPNALLNFLGVIPQPLTERLRHIKIAAYKSAHTKTAMNFLAKARNIIELDIESGVAAAAEPVKAAEIFHGDIRVLVDAITATLKERGTAATKGDALKVIKLGEKALVYKEKHYSEAEREEFSEALLAKLK
ncbi:hypothetical protein AMS68_001932 [Peltaster fructicola]|uniref:Uncharacterized protein n=1 Tax=Peltaster fructicola TaxID=286661 RepID=A0A6H0XP59_9PEZI|nr:hypothetical protein AMS68_001932 [Peltaster fructicola]